MSVGPRTSACPGYARPVHLLANTTFSHTDGQSLDSGSVGMRCPSASTDRASMPSEVVLHVEQGFPMRSDMQVNDSVDNDGVPRVTDESTAGTGNRLIPAPLSRTAIAFLKRALEQKQLRRRAYRASRLHVRIDGQVCQQFDPMVGPSPAFRVPVSAAYLEIFGDDAEGDLLLAVFPLTEPTLSEDGQAQRLSVTLEGGRTLALDIAPSYGACRQMQEYVI